MKKITIIIRIMVIVTNVICSANAVGTLENLVIIKTRDLDEVKNLVTDDINAELKTNLDAINNNPYKAQTAHIRVGNELSDGEQIACTNRSLITRAAFQKLLNNPKLLEKNIILPKVSFIASGGGYRAMAITLGFLEGAQQTGLLDSITYMSVLSGSTWALGGYLNALAQATLNGDNITVKQYSDQFYTLINGKSLTSGFDADDICLLNNAILVDLVYDQPITAVTLFGILLANRFFGKTPDRHRRYISQQSEIVKSGQTIIPIYTAVQGEDNLNQTELEWYEFTPWEMGGAWLNHYVPMWAYGRKFDKGISQDDAPEKSLGFNLGTFGSAFSVTLVDLWNAEQINIDNPFVQEVVKQILASTLASKRVTYAEVFNFTLDMPGTIYQNNQTMRLVDGGFAFNLPYPVVSEERPERASNILIFFDASDDLEGASQLKLASEYALRKKLKFPKINFDELQGKATAFKIFKDENDISVPIVIYMTATNGNLSPDYPANFDLKKCTDEGFCTTDTFTTTKENAAILRKAAEVNITAVKNQIFDVYRDWIDKHNP